MKYYPHLEHGVVFTKIKEDFAEEKKKKSVR